MEAGMDNKYNKISIVFIVMIFIFIPQLIPAQTFTGDTSRSSEGLGNYIGEFTYRLFSPTAAELDVTLQNTGPSGKGGFLTGFLFNNPGSYITGVNLSGTNPFFSLIGGPGFQNSISASPFGNFDIGAAVGGNFLGGGNPGGGIPVGGDARFSFTVTGNNLDKLNASSFVQAQSSEGDFFISRFRGFEGGGSDKVPAGSNQVSEPDIIFLIGAGLVGIAIFNKLNSIARLKKKIAKQ